MLLDFQSGRFVNQEVQAKRTLGELAAIFRANSAIVKSDSSVVYEIHGSPSEVDCPGQLLYATTVLYPGQVGGEYFMTRGHFHTRTDRGEFMLTLQGEGALILMDRDRKTWTEPMLSGSVHNIDGNHAHRVANTGLVPLVFLVVWMSDCGHDYESIRESGFSKLLVNSPDGPKLIDSPN